MVDSLFFTQLAFISLSFTSSQFMEYGNRTDPCQLFLYECAYTQSDHGLNSSLQETWSVWRNKSSIETIEVGGEPGVHSQLNISQTLGFSSGGDLRILRSQAWLHAQCRVCLGLSLPLPLPLPYPQACSHSQINKSP